MVTTGRSFSLGCYLKAPAQSGLFVDGAAQKRKTHAPVSPKTSYRLDNRHCAGDTKNSGEKQVIVGQRKTTTKACEQGKRDQVPQGWRHIHTASDLIA